MKITNAVIAAFATAIPAVCALPTSPSARQFSVPTCSASQCLTETPGLFNACAPNDLVCLCTLPQSEINTYVNTVQSCVDNSDECTAGAIYQYKDLLKTVCQSPDYGNKTVAWAPTPSA